MIFRLLSILSLFSYPITRKIEDKGSWTRMQPCYFLYTVQSIIDCLFFFIGKILSIIGENTSSGRGAKWLMIKTMLKKHQELCMKESVFTLKIIKDPKNTCIIYCLMPIYLYPSLLPLLMALNGPKRFFLGFFCYNFFSIC